MPHFHVSFDCNWAIKTLCQLHANTQIYKCIYIVMRIKKRRVCFVHTHVGCHVSEREVKAPLGRPAVYKAKSNIIIALWDPITCQSEIHPGKKRPRDRVRLAYYLSISMQKHSHHIGGVCFYLLDRLFYRSRWKMFIAALPMVLKMNAISIFPCVCAYGVNIKKRSRRETREREIYAHLSPSYLQ
jgi:hypothetical protein